MGRIPNGLMGLVYADTRTITAEEIQANRENGVGNGFKVLNPGDGFRRDGSLWFGTCSVCGERVSNSLRDGVWKHTIYTSKTYNENGLLASATSYESEVCPTASENLA